MAQIGLDHLVYAKVLTDTAEGMTFDTPKPWAPAQSADINPNTASGDLPGDDGIVIHIDELSSVTVTVGSTNLPTQVEADLLGKTIDENGVLGTNKADKAPEIAIGFRTKNAENGYTYYWFYKGTFAEYQRQLQTKGTDIAFATPSIVGTFKHPLSGRNIFDKVNDTDESIPAAVITNWFTTVYDGEPVGS